MQIRRGVSCVCVGGLLRHRGSLKKNLGPSVECDGFLYSNMNRWQVALSIFIFSIITPVLFSRTLLKASKAANQPHSLRSSQSNEHFCKRQRKAQPDHYTNVESSWLTAVVGSAEFAG